MSCLFAWISPKRARVAVDTAIVNPDDDTLRMGSKAFVIPHAMALVAGRGDTTTTGLVFSMLNSHAADFDGMVKILPATILKVQTMRADVGYRPRAGHGAELVVVGWSKEYGQVAGWRFMEEPGSEAMQGLMLKGGHIAPSVGIKDGREPRGYREVVKFSKERIRAVKEAHPDAPYLDAFGGEVLMFDITRDAINIVRAGSLL